MNSRARTALMCTAIFAYLYATEANAQAFTFDKETSITAGGCLASLKDLAVFVWETANSDLVKALIWLSMTTLGLVRLLLKLAIPEACDLAAALLVALICVIVLAATGSPATQVASAKLRQCTAQETNIALATHPSGD